MWGLENLCGTILWGQPKVKHHGYMKRFFVNYFCQIVYDRVQYNHWHSMFLLLSCWCVLELREGVCGQVSVVGCWFCISSLGRDSGPHRHIHVTSLGIKQ